MNAWGLFIILVGAVILLLGITGKGGQVLNGVRVRSGNPSSVKGY